MFKINDRAQLVKELPEVYSGPWKDDTKLAQNHIKAYGGQEGVISRITEHENGLYVYKFLHIVDGIAVNESVNVPPECLIAI